MTSSLPFWLFVSRQFGFPFGSTVTSFEDAPSHRSRPKNSGFLWLFKRTCIRTPEFTAVEGLHEWIQWPLWCKIIIRIINGSEISRKKDPSNHDWLHRLKLVPRRNEGVKVDWSVSDARNYASTVQCYATDQCGNCAVCLFDYFRCLKLLN